MPKSGHCPQAALRDGKVQCLSPKTCLMLMHCQVLYLQDRMPLLPYLRFDRLEPRRPEPDDR